MQTAVKDYVLVTGAYVVWGVLPIFWSMLAGVESITVLYQRTLWSAIFLGIWLLSRGKLRVTCALLTTARVVKATILSSFFLATNWLSYLYALENREYLAASTAYYICPIMSVIVSALFMRERVTTAQKAALLLMLLGAILPAYLDGTVPWLAFVIGGSWCGYAAVRKWFAVSTVEGLFLETVILGALMTVAFPFAVGADGFVGSDTSLVRLMLFIFAGLATALPIVALVEGMRSVPFAAIGVLQYLVPSVMLAVSILYFQVPPNFAQCVGLGVIWLGILTYLLGSLLQRACNPLDVTSSDTGDMLASLDRQVGSK